MVFKTKNLKKSFIVSVIIIPIILSLFFYYGYHESLFGKKPDIKISIATIIRTPVLEKPFNLSNDEDKGKIVKYLYENNWMPLTAWKTNTMYERFDPEKKLNFCVFNYFVDDDYNKDMLGSKFHYYNDEFLKFNNCDNCIDGYIVISNDGNKIVDNMKMNLCIGKNFYFKKEELSGLNLIETHCVRYEDDNLGREEKSAFFKVFSYKESPKFDIIEIYNPKEPDGKFRIGNYPLIETKTRNILYNLVEGKYYVWNREFNVNNNSIFKFISVIVPNCYY